MTEEEIIQRVKESFPDAIVDSAGADCNFQLYVISKTFEGQSLLQRQRSVLALFAPELKDGRLHALSVTAKTPQDEQAVPHLVQVKINT